MVVFRKTFLTPPQKTRALGPPPSSAWDKMHKMMDFWQSNHRFFRTLMPRVRPKNISHSCWDVNSSLRSQCLNEQHFPDIKLVTDNIWYVHIISSKTPVIHFILPWKTSSSTTFRTPRVHKWPQALQGSIWSIGISRDIKLVTNNSA